MKTTTKKRLLLIPVYILVFLVLWVAASFVSIEVRYRAHEKKILNHPSEASEEYYYFNQLTYKEQLLFKSIKDAAEKHENESDIVPYRYTEDEFLCYSILTRILSSFSAMTIKLLLLWGTYPPHQTSRK